jgi:uncharacterized membrane protein YcfT
MVKGLKYMELHFQMPINLHGVVIEHGTALISIIVIMLASVISLQTIGSVCKWTKKLNELTALNL